MQIWKCFFVADWSFSPGNCLLSIDLATIILFARLTLSAVPASKCKRLNNVASRNALDVSTIQDKSTVFVEKSIFHFNNGPVENGKQGSLHRMTERYCRFTTVWPTVEYTTLSSSCVFSVLLLNKFTSMNCLQRLQGYTDNLTNFTHVHCLRLENSMVSEHPQMDQKFHQFKKMCLLIWIKRPAASVLRSVLAKSSSAEMRC